MQSRNIPNALPSPTATESPGQPIELEEATSGAAPLILLGDGDAAGACDLDGTCV